MFLLIYSSASTYDYPLRVHYDTSYLNYKKCLCNSTSETTCFSTTCTSNDIPNTDSIEKVKKTLDAVSKHISNFLYAKYPRFKVIPYQTSDHPEFSDYPPPPSKVECADVYIQVVLRSLESTGQTAYSKIFDVMDGTPSHGMLILSASYVNSVPASDVNSTDRRLFNTIIHETFHILGLHKGYLPDWINPATNETYGNVSKMTEPSQIPEYGAKQFTLLTTPKALEVIKKRFNPPEDEPATGIELEDGGESSRFSHTEARVFYGDIMMGYSNFNLAISEITLAMLEDTGFYKVDYNYSEPLAWGDHKFFNGVITDEFLFDEPSRFPQNYLCNDNDAITQATVGNDYRICSFDYIGLARCKIQRSIDCKSSDQTVDEKYYCDSREFFNPNNNTYTGTDRIVDWIPAKETLSLCQPNQRCAMIGTPQSNTGKCVNLVSHDSTSYKIEYNGQTATCTKEGEFVQLGDQQVKCEHIFAYPNVENYYKTTKSQMDGGFIHREPPQTPQIEPTPDNSNKKLLMKILIPIGVILLLIGIAVLIIVCVIQKKKASPEVSNANNKEDPILV